MPPGSKPAYTEKMIAIATFQNLVLDKTTKKEIARQNDLHVPPPSFGNTWSHNIALLNPVMRVSMIGTIALIPKLVFIIPALVTMFNIWSPTSTPVLFYRIIASAATITGLKWLIFFATTWIISSGLKKVLTKLVENMVARFKATKENSILDDLAKQNAWWKSEEGKTAYENHKNAKTQLECARVAEFEKADAEQIREQNKGKGLFEETAQFAYLHAKVTTASELKSEVHIWDDNFSDMIEKEDKIKSMKTLVELADEQICKLCSNHVAKIADAAIAQAAK